MAEKRSATVGPAARPVAVPGQFLSGGQDVVQGAVLLPLHIWWSEPQRRFDLRHRTDLLRVYGLVLAEGTEADVLRFIDPEVLLSIWSELHLPRYVQEAWEMAFSEWGARPRASS